MVIPLPVGRHSWGGLELGAGEGVCYIHMWMFAYDCICDTLSVFVFCVCDPARASVGRSGGVWKPVNMDTLHLESVCWTRGSAVAATRDSTEAGLVPPRQHSSATWAVSSRWSRQGT